MHPPERAFTRIVIPPGPSRGLRPGLLFSLLFGLLFGTASCTSKPIGYSDFDAGTDFTQFQSFSWLPGKTLITTSPEASNPKLEGYFKEAVQRNLTARGYSFTTNVEEADMVIGFTAGAVSTVRTTAFTENYRQVRIIGSSRDTEVVNQQSLEGGIVIDIYDQASGQKKWTGWTNREIERSDQINLQQTSRELVDVVLQHFPPDV